MNLKMNSVMSSVTVLVATFPTLLPHPPLNLLKKMSTSLDLLNQIPQLDRCHLSLVANTLTPRMMNLILTSLRFMFTKLRKLKKSTQGQRLQRGWQGACFDCSKHISCATGFSGCLSEYFNGGEAGKESLETDECGEWAKVPDYHPYYGYYSKFFFYILTYVTSIIVSRLRLEGRNFRAKLKQKWPLSLRPYTALTADEANVQLQKTVRKLKSWKSQRALFMRYLISLFFLL